MGRRQRDVAEPEQTPYEIGLWQDGFSIYFRQENEKLISRQSKDKNHGLLAKAFCRKPVPARYLGAEDQRQLRRGAIEAFHSGRPSGVQSILATPDRFAIREGIVDTFASKEYNVRENVLTELIKGSENPGADINLALESVYSVYKDRKNYSILNDLLYFAFVSGHSPDRENFILSLLDAADAAKYDIGKGHVLCEAVVQNYPESFIEKLYKRGADFDDALKHASSGTVINYLKVYREKYSGEPAGDDARFQVAAETALDKLRAGIISPLVSHEISPATSASQQLRTSRQTIPRIVRRSVNTI